MSESDSQDYVKHLQEIIVCANSWEADVRLLGNVRAEDIRCSCRDALNEIQSLRTKLAGKDMHNHHLHPWHNYSQRHSIDNDPSWADVANFESWLKERMRPYSNSEDFDLEFENWLNSMLPTTMLYAACCDIHDAQNAHIVDLNKRVQALQAVVDKLPRTADGVDIILGMIVYAVGDYEEGKAIESGQVKGIYALDKSGNWWVNFGSDEAAPKECYSTQEAAQAALEQQGGESIENGKLRIDNAGKEGGA